MVYAKLVFPTPIGRPFFYTSFVTTVDGKVWVNRPGYWPIGSKTDYDVFTFLRAHADAIIDGKNTALRFGKNTIQTINNASFLRLRKRLHREKAPSYVVVTQNPDEQLQKALTNPYGFKTIIWKKRIDELVTFLNKEGCSQVFIDGGPTLLASFLAQNLLDEIFLTIAPKIFGNEKGITVTMVEGKLFTASCVKRLELLSVKKRSNEVFLRYRVNHD